MANGARWRQRVCSCLDAHNQLVVQLRALQAKELLPPVATRKAGG